MNEIRPQTRDAILEAAFQVFGQDPGASLSEVASRAGVGRATLHRHFKGRDALAHRALEELDRAVEAATKDAASYGEALRSSLETIVPLADRHGFLSREPVEDDLQVMAGYLRQQKELAEAIDAAKAEGCFGAEVPTPWIVQAFEGLIYAAWELVRAGEATPRQASAWAWRTLTQGLGGDGDGR